MGRTTEGRPFFYLCITSEENLANLEELRDVQARLADPRGLSGQDEGSVERLKARAKSVVMLSCSIHATEVGAAQMSMELAYELETSSDPRTLSILDNVILLLVPSLNPDGLDMVVDWYQRHLGTSFEGTSPPFLYQKYAGHDNNRDWFMLNLVENRQTVLNIHNVWHPHIVFDLHQMGDLGFRFFVPPYMDPWEPNIDYILRQETAELGLHMVGELLSAGKTGVSCYNGYDAFAPSRAFQHYHGGVRILSEAASVKIATPIGRKQEELKPTRDGSDPKIATWNHPAPWPGGPWHLRDIVEYDKLAAYGCLDHAARFRDKWVANFYSLSKRACERKDVYAAILPAGQSDPVMAHELLTVLSMGQVEIHRATEDFEVDGVRYGAGTHVIFMAQPYGAYAKTLLERQRYPDLRQYPGGPPKLPYDVTGHTLPLLMGVNVTFAAKRFEAQLQKIERPALPEGGVRYPASSAGVKECGYVAISPEITSSAKVVNGVLRSAGDAELFRTACSFRQDGRLLPAGTFLVPHRHFSAVEDLCRAAGVEACPLHELPASKVRLCRETVGVYRSSRPVVDEGWLRYVLEEYGFPYENVNDGRIRNDNLRKRFGVIIFPSQSASFMADGNKPGSYPAEYTGGLGVSGKDAVARFLQEGGTCVFLDAACAWAVDQLGLPAKNVLADKKPQEFFAPGSILRTIVDTEHPLGYGLRRETPVMFAGGPAWELSAGTVVARYPMADPLLSGWLLGGQFLHDAAAIAEFGVGAGKVVLIGFHPHFRAQARGTYKVIFNCIYGAGSKA